MIFCELLKQKNLKPRVEKKEFFSQDNITKPNVLDKKEFISKENTQRSDNLGSRTAYYELLNIKNIKQRTYGKHLL